MLVRAIVGQQKPAERLTVRASQTSVYCSRCILGGQRGIRTPDTLFTYTRFPGERLQPLGHLSYLCPSVKTAKAKSAILTEMQTACPGAVSGRSAIVWLLTGIKTPEGATCIGRPSCANAKIYPP